MNFPAPARLASPCPCPYPDPAVADLLSQVFWAVMARGGYEEVTGGKLWLDVCRSLPVDLRGMTSSSFNMRQNYERYLLGFERYLASGQVGDGRVAGWVDVGQVPWGAQNAATTAGHICSGQVGTAIAARSATGEMSLLIDCPSPPHPAGLFCSTSGIWRLDACHRVSFRLPWPLPAQAAVVGAPSSAALPSVAPPLAALAAARTAAARTATEVPARALRHWEALAACGRGSGVPSAAAPADLSAHRARQLLSWRRRQYLPAGRSGSCQPGSAWHGSSRSAGRWASCRRPASNVAATTMQW